MAMTDTGTSHKITAQVTDVHKALLSVSKTVKAGNRVVFDEDGSYIENKKDGTRTPIEWRNGGYALKVWVHREQASPF